MIIFSGTSIIAKTKPNHFSRSITSNKQLIIFASVNSFLIIVIATYIILKLVARSEFSLSSNRSDFDNNYYYFNYIFILVIPFVIINALSSSSSNLSRRLSAAAWIICLVLLLFSGNRQFFFFSVIYLSFYFLGRSRTPKILFRKIQSFAIAGFLFVVFFSIARLDYLGDSDGNLVAKYMSSLTGASCTSGGDYCDSFAETIFQLVYAYLGMNHSGLAYSIDFYNEKGGLPTFLSTFPLLYRRLESAFALNSYSKEQDYYNFVANQAGGTYSNFFSTMFGAFGIEFGWIGVLSYSSLLVFATWYFSRRCASSKSTDLDYNLYVLILTAYIFGIMQAPTTEPFYTMIILSWSLLALANSVAKK